MPLPLLMPLAVSAVVGGVVGFVAADGIDSLKTTVLYGLVGVVLYKVVK